MKFTEKTFNPLYAILQTVPNREPELATVEQIQTVVSLLELGGVQCATHKDTVTCLQLLQDLDLLSVVVINEHDNVYIKLGNIYNGK